MHQGDVTRFTTKTIREQLAQDATPYAVASTISGKTKPLGEPLLVVRQMRCQAGAGFVVHVQTLPRNFYSRRCLQPYGDWRSGHVVTVRRGSRSGETAFMV